MTAFLKIDECSACRRSLPWEWVPAVLLNGKPLAGTGVWSSQLTERLCGDCMAALHAQRREKERALALHMNLMRILGGESPYRSFTFERFEVIPGNRRGY